MTSGLCRTAATRSTPPSASPSHPKTTPATWQTCLGLASASDAVVKTAVARLGKDLITFLRERAPDVDQQPELARYLADGTLERHLESIE
jgi:hypothetical protein